MAVGGEVSFLLVQPDPASFHQQHGRSRLQCCWFHYAGRVNSRVRPLWLVDRKCVVQGQRMSAGVALGGRTRWALVTEVQTFALPICPVRWWYLCPWESSPSR